MKTYLLLFFAFLGFLGSRAAAQHIPDPNFAAAIRSECPACIDANDNLTASAATLTFLLVDNRNITDLTGIEYFTSLTYLYCDRNQLTTLPPLPNSLSVLYCSNNQISSLPTLPDTLDKLHANYNLLTTLPFLPNTITELNLSYNDITSLPNIPREIESLDIGGTLISSLPTLPASLWNLDVGNTTLLYCLPQLPSGLWSLNLILSNIQCIPNQPPNIDAIHLDGVTVCTPNNPNNCPVYSDFLGYTYMDFNNNCTYESNTDSILPNTLVVITTSNNDTFSIYSNAQGFYSIQMPDSLVVSSQIFPSPAVFFNACPASVYTTTSNNAIGYLGAQPTIFAPIMEVDIEAVLLRRCFASNYVVLYSNVGTAVGTNAYIDIEFDSYLAYVSNSANLTAMALGNNTYRFDLGDVGQGASGSFSITVDVSCDANLGQVHCTNAHIYPDLTASLANWSGPVIEITDTCLTDSVLFQITNTGGAMSTTQTYQIIEDNLMYRPATPFLLAAGQSLDVVVPAQESSVYRIEATQATGFPAVLGDNPAWATVQNCNGISSTSANFVQQFYTNYGNVSQANDCEANRGAYDPNDKNAQILGYGAQNCIAANTNLDYKIRFQNTGTDTAFRVFILDTLSVNVLDINTIRMGASSHNYTWELLDNNVLRFVFDDIRLVDSFTNEPLSNGFISFSIDQIADLPVGSVIENSAAIYFDFNAPVITNTAMHTICADFVLLGNTELLQENIEIVASPNPFDNQTIIKISSAQNTPLSLQLYDATGRVVQQLESSNNQFELMRNDLPSGVYFYQIFSAQQPIGRGKLIAR
jgi:hypothetical protein